MIKIIPSFNAKLIKVLVTTLTLKGNGKKDDPYRRITQYWSLEGELLAEVDPLPEEYEEPKDQ